MESSSNSHRVEISERQIRIDSVPRQILSGAIHYFRTLPEQWGDRLDKAKALGLDAVETYFAWNLHEPEEGLFNFSGMLDVERFIEMIAGRGMLTIIRPGPFICAEWNNGGLPPWLTAKSGCQVRRDNPVYMAAVERWFDELLPRLEKHQYTRGGSIILCAVENEYGSYGCDKIYLKKLHDLIRRSGFDIPLITADGGGNQSMVIGGLIPGCPAFLTMGPDECMKKLALKRTIRPNEPDCCMEYWCGNFDWWGHPHTIVPIEKSSDHFEQMVTAGVSVNLYMFHGGTNFAFNNGANLFGEDDFRPQTTSYDYDTLLDESGEPTPKFHRFHEIIRKYRPWVPKAEIVPGRKIAFGKIAVTGSAPLFDHLDELAPVRHTSDAEPMEFFGQYTGFLLYRTRLQGPFGNMYPASLRLYEPRDRAQLFLDGHFLGDVIRTEKGKEFPVQIDKSEAVLDILLENLGYINFGPAIGNECKGIAGIMIDNQYQNTFECRSLPMQDISGLKFEPFRKLPENTPSFHRAFLEIGETADSFLRFPGRKGIAWINGFCLGRYWDIGPGDALYVPAPVLKKGKNEIIVFELYGLAGDHFEFLSERHFEALVSSPF